MMIAGVRWKRRSADGIKQKSDRIFRCYLTFMRAEDGAQTRDPQLGRLMLYRLSYFRMFCILCVGKDGFEPPKAKASRFTVCPIWPLWYLPLRSVESLFFSIAMQRYDYFFNLQAKSNIFIAVIAHSSPLLPSFPPARFSACCILFVVMRP